MRRLQMRLLKTLSITEIKMSLIHNAETMKDLVGFKIIRAIEDASEPDFFGFQIKKGKQEFNVWVLRDEEGNGSGRLVAEGV